MLTRLSILLFIVLLSACGEKPISERRSFDYQKIKKSAEDRKRNFNPGFVRAFHAARVYAIRDYEIYDSLITIRGTTMPVMKRVAGELPEPNAPGAFQVIVMSEKDTLYHYGMESPLYIRREHGPEPGLLRVKAGSFLVAVPPVQNATKIILKDADGTEHVSTFRIE